jgi:adenosyl cobinamide kinase/adenosyl cobinamide phosphate guanylyltransferase
MSLVLLLGGARSGKSRQALRLAAASGRRVSFIATAEPRDAEMAARIARHRRERPGGWDEVEEPLELRAAIARVPAGAVLVVDCLSLWVSNMLERGSAEDEIELDGAAAAAEAAAREGLSIAVSNEVGLGIVPASNLGRRYRDALGRVNAAWADAADEAFLVVAGRLLRLERAPGA